MEKNLQVYILGSGCKNCNHLEEETKKALEEMGLKAELGHITDFLEIAKYGVMQTPALVVDGKVVLSGYVAKKEEIKGKIQEVIGE